MCEQAKELRKRETISQPPEEFLSCVQVEIDALNLNEILDGSREQ
jgi:hypothetical protein